ncbi:DUF1932 domain-containing protein [Nocardia carnea]|uniref:DUF1932 domain-containing protein n=1 Tax=Nocardia carnea TaxID=37328 RepID=UPI002454AFC6|nr:DUF1932 domain-containing protein [Nocardia carnea]
MIVGLLHPGQMGSAVAARLTDAGHTVLWYPNGRSAATAERASKARLQPSGLPELFAEAEIVLSICPAHTASDVAALAAQHRYTGIFVDANAVSPKRMRDIHRLLADTTTVVDAAISGRPPQEDQGPRIFLAGPDNDTAPVHTLFASSGLTSDQISPSVGAASTLKMITAYNMRASRAQAAISHALADMEGLSEVLITEANNLGAHFLADRDFIPKAAARAWRWEKEMYEIAETLREANLPAESAEATAHVFRLWETMKDQWDATPEEALQHLRDRAED